MPFSKKNKIILRTNNIMITEWQNVKNNKKNNK